MPQPDNTDSKAGFLFALGAYLLWGFLPFYMKAVAHIPPFEVVAHRVIWSIPVTAVVIFWLGRTADIRKAIRTPRTLAMGALTATLITVNWGIYVWAIGAGRALETALGYYINPLFSIFLGAVLLGEKMSRPQWVAIALAAIAVAILTWDAGGLPWVSLGLAISWGFYAFFKKTLPIGPTQGFFLEILILVLPAVAFLLYLDGKGQGHFIGAGAKDMTLLMFAGIVTAVPLILYANGAKLLRLTTIAIMQYIAPTMIFLVAVFVFREEFGPTKLVAFLFIWTALAVYSWTMFAGRRRAENVARVS